MALELVECAIHRLTNNPTGSVVDVDHEDYSGDGNDDGSSVAGVVDDDDDDDDDDDEDL